MTNESVRVVVLALLDADHDLVLQSFEFRGRSSLTIGRARDNDLVLANPFVSRAHAILRKVDGLWELQALSEQGVMIDGERKERHRLSEGDAFRLGSSGPCLRFSDVEDCPAAESMSTIVERAADLVPQLVLDERKRDREVEGITAGVFFQELLRKAADLKRRAEEPGEGC